MIMRCAFLAPLFTLVFAAVCAGRDVVLLKDGRSVEGIVIEDATDHVKIDGIVAGIRSQMVFKRQEVRSVTRSPLPKGFFDPAPARKPEDKPKESAGPREGEDLKEADPKDAGPKTAGAGDDTKAKDTRRTYVVVPLTGTFGEEIQAEGVAQALDLAIQQKFDTIVFEIDSPGGKVNTAQKIATVMKERSKKLHYYAHVENALSASVWVLSGCEKLYVDQGAAIGAAVAFTRDKSTGAAEVDAKMNSALAAEVASAAETKGQNPLVYRAMMLPEQRIFVWTDKDGNIQIREKAAEASDKVSCVEVDTATSVLTLTAGDAVKWGVAEDWDKCEFAAEWKENRAIGERSMSKAAKLAGDAKQRRDRDLQEIEDSINKLPILADDARQKDPTRYQDYYVRGDTLTAESRRKWQQRTDDAIAAWDTLIRGIRQIQTRMKRFSESDFHPDLLTKLKQADLSAQKEIGRLQAERNR